VEFRKKRIQMQWLGRPQEFIPGPEAAISFSPCVGELKKMEWLKERHHERWTFAPGMRPSRLFTEHPSYKMCRGLLAYEWKEL
jgi:hypothetical protein